MPVNQCVVCGAELQEGNMVCDTCCKKYGYFKDYINDLLEDI